MLRILINYINRKEIVRYGLPAYNISFHAKLPEMSRGLYVARLAGDGAGGMVKFVVE
jgi:hypothetical protein